MSKNYTMPRTADESNDIVFLCEHYYETTGLAVLRTAAEELRRLYDLLKTDPVEVEQYAPNLVIRMNLVMRIGSRYFNMTQAELVSQARSTKYITPRHIVMYLAKELTNLSYPQIGAWFNRDHSTIVHGHDKIKDMIKTNNQIKKYVEEITVLCQKQAMEEHRRIEEIKKCPNKPPIIRTIQKPQTLTPPKP